MILFHILLIVYILSVNFSSYCLVRRQRAEYAEDKDSLGKGDGKLLLAAMLGGATAIYATMFAMRFRTSNLLLMITLPVLAVLNGYLFYLGFRSIYLFL